MSCGNNKSTGHFYSAVNGYTTWPINNWYYDTYGTLPQKYSSTYSVKIDEFLNKYEKDIIFREVYYDRERKIDELYCATIKLDNKGTIVYLNDIIDDKKQKFRKSVINIFYSEETPAFKAIKKYIGINAIKEEKKGVINLLCKTQSGGFTLKEYSIKSPDIDFNINYNEGFKEIDDIIISRLNEENGKGIVMLYGDPGTGKTSYIRRLINNVNKRVLYLPPDMATELSNPGLVPFLTDIPNSILIVEDAENVLLKRHGQHNQAISNLLNLSDGLFGDCLNIQIVATFNTNLANIDEALLRKGRLISKYEFKKLSSDRVKKLAKKIGVKFSNDSGTLAEIYNAEDRDFSNSNKKQIGFKVAKESVAIDSSSKKKD